MSRETPSDLRAMAHPMRLRILSLVTGAALSATEVARELEVSHATASYHLRVLADVGLVQREQGAEVASAARAAGRPAVRYRYHPYTPEAHFGRAERRLLSRAALTELGRKLDLMRRRQLLSDAEVWLEPDVWAEVCEHADRINELVHGRASAPRAPGTLHVSVTTALFEM
jgi:predicted ArsR family transcriptional regulator